MPLRRTAALPARLRRFLAVLPLACCLFAPAGTDGAESDVSDFGVSTTTTLPDSPEADNVLRSAREAIQRRDWKVAADALQRLIEERFDALISVDGKLYESPRYRALRQVAALPPEGLRTYRLLYGGQAAALFEQARRDHDVALLSQVVDRYFLTEVGDEAADLLAAWLIDAGKPARALARIRDVLTLYPDSDLPRAMLLARQAVAATLLGLDHLATTSTRAFHGLAVADPALGELSEALRDFNADPPTGAPARGSFDVTSMDPTWPCLLGPAHRTGRMSVVVPTIADVPPWKYRMPLERGDPPARLLQKQEALRAYPASYPVTDDRRLFVRTEQQVIALDLESMEELWRTRRIVDSLARVAADWDYDYTITLLRRDGRAARVEDRTGQVLRTLLDELSACLAVIGPRVYAIDRYGHSEYTQFNDVADVPTDRAHAGDQAPDAPPGPSRPFRLDGRFSTRLVAVDTETGRTRWSRGRSGDSRDPLGTGLFAGPPVDFGDSILAPYRQGNDFFLVRLSKDDGHMLDRLYLCGQETDDSMTLWAVHIARTDQTLYVPVGGGFLIAVDADRLHVRWASAYPVRRTERTYGKGTSPLSRRGGWLSCPPVRIGTVVVSAPPDADELFGFDATTGRMRWRVPRGRHRYILGGAGHTVFLGGDTVSGLDTETGDTLWEVRVGDGRTTGRGALSGERILLPTRAGLLMLDAGTGRTVDRKPLPAGQTPLGNLLCLNGSMFSAEVVGLRKFPDLEHNYPRTLEQCRREPGNPVLNLRLAWLEAVRENPEGVLAALGNVEENDERVDALRRRQIRHLRAEAYLDLAERTKEEPARAEDLLTRALKQAVSFDDLAQVRLARARLSTRSGRFVEGYRRFVSVLDPPAANGVQASAKPEDPLIASGDGLRRRLSSVVREHLQELEEHLSDRQKEALAEEYGRRLTLATQSRNLRTIHQLAELMVLGGAGEQALLELATRNRDRRKYELAEGCYRRVIRQGVTREYVARALAELADMLIEPQQDLLISADELLKRLEREFQDTRFQPRMLTPDSPDAMEGREVVRHLRRRLDPQRLSARSEALALELLNVSGKRAWRYPIEEPTRLIRFAGDVPEAAAAAAFCLVNDVVVARHDLSDGSIEWPASLRVLARMQAVETSEQDDPFSLERRTRPSDRARPARAAFDGQTMIITSPIGLHAVGMVTGRAIWDKPLTLVNPRSDSASGFVMSLENGLVACIIEPGRLQLMRAADGAVLWERQGGPSDFRALRLAGGRVFVIDQQGNRVSCYDCRDGEFLGTYDFVQEDSDFRPGILILNDVVCGPQEDAIVAYDVADGGQIWSVQPTSPVCSVFKPREDLVGVGMVDGRCVILEPQSGRRLMETSLPEFNAGVYDGSVDENVLCLVGERRLSAKDRVLTMAGVDLHTGEVIWSANDLPRRIKLAHVQIVPRMVSRLPHWIPLYDYPQGFRKGARRLAGQHPRARLTFIDKKTGRSVEKSIEFEADTTTRFVPDLLVRSDQVLILTGKYLHCFGRPVERGLQTRLGERAAPPAPGNRTAGS